VRAAARDLDDRPRRNRIRLLLRLEAAIRERVARDSHRLPRLQPALADGLVRARAGYSDREQDDRRMDDVATVPPPVLADETDDRARRAAAAHELEHDRSEHECGEGVGEQPRRGRARSEERRVGKEWRGRWERA